MKRHDGEWVDRMAEQAYYDSGKKKKVLVVDDNRSFLAYVGKVFGSWGANVHLLTDPCEALRAFVAFRPDLVILDVNMPRISGVSLGRMLQEVNLCHARIVLVSANGHRRREVLACAGEGVSGFLEKPVLPADLRGLLREE